MFSLPIRFIVLKNAFVVIVRCCIAQFPVGLIKFIEEILNGKIHFLCNALVISNHSVNQFLLSVTVENSCGGN